jgi:hypothetical protein
MATQIQPSSLKASMTPLDLGLESQKIFRSIGIFCHGFLAGLAFWQLIMVKNLFLNPCFVLIVLYDGGSVSL